MSVDEQIQETIENVFQQDEILKEYETLLQQAEGLGESLCRVLDQKAMNGDVLNLNVAILALSRTMIYLSRLGYETDDQFVEHLEIARDITYERVTLAIDNPQRCQTCPSCLVGELCETPVIDTRVDFRMIPLIANSLVEYAQWSQLVQEASQPEAKESAE